MTAAYPRFGFRFQVQFKENRLGGQGNPKDFLLCNGAFSECTGLEATMEPKVIKEGGRNYGVAQRTGPVTFGTVILKRGVTDASDLWKWFELVHSGGYSYRLDVTVRLLDETFTTEVFSWKLVRALPVKFKAGDLNAKGGEVLVEELHLAHEGLQFQPKGGAAQ